MHGAGVYLPYLDNASLARVDRIQRDAAALILGVPRSTKGDVMLYECGMRPAAALAAREAGRLLARGFMRRRADDPLLRVSNDGRSTWAKLGASALEKLHILPCLLERDCPPGLDSGLDIWGDVYAGRLELAREEATAVDLDRHHEDCAWVYYVDGAEGRCRGAAACVAYRRGEWGPSSVSAEPLRLVCDSFVAEQCTILDATSEALRDASRGDRVAILSDSLSNIASISSAGARDPREEQIMRNLRALAGAGVRVCLRFVRGHRGCIGNELADRACKKVAADPAAYRANRIVPRHVAFSHLNGGAAGELMQRIYEQTLAGGGSSKTADHYWKCTGLKPNKVLARAGDYSAHRLTEIAYNMCRCNTDVFANGYRWDLEGDARTRCVDCGATDGGVLHQLFDCPARAAGRAVCRNEINSLRAENPRGVEQGWKHKWRARQAVTGKRKWPTILDSRAPWWPERGDPAVIGEYPEQIVGPLAGSSLWIYRWHRGGGASVRLT